MKISRIVGKYQEKYSIPTKNIDGGKLFCISRGVIVTHGLSAWAIAPAEAVATAKSEGECIIVALHYEVGRELRPIQESVAR